MGAVTVPLAARFPGQGAGLLAAGEGVEGPGRQCQQVRLQRQQLAGILDVDGG